MAASSAAADSAVGHPEEQQAGVGRDVAGGELGDEFPAADTGKGDGRCGTVCNMWLFGWRWGGGASEEDRCRVILYGSPLHGLPYGLDPEVDPFASALRAEVVRS